MLPWVAAAAAALLSIAFNSLSGTNHYIDGACERVNSYLHSEIIGQELAIDQLVAAVCHHLKQKEPRGPLILSAHGPPGVGKTATHQRLAQALYQANPAQAMNCPGPQCTGYKVIYGLDFLTSEAGQQLSAVRSSVLDHLRHSPESLLVIEEYDKLDCSSRAMFRQLLDHPEIANVTMNRAIVMMESNLGMKEMKLLVDNAGGRDKVSIHDANRQLKNLLRDTWDQEKSGVDCESWEDIVKLAGLITHYLPYLPLGRPELKQLVERELVQYRATEGLPLVWDDHLLSFLVSQIDVEEEGWPLDGARGIRHMLVNAVDIGLMRRHEAIAQLRDAIRTRTVAGLPCAAPSRSVRLAVPRGTSMVVDVQIEQHCTDAGAH